MEKRKRSRKGWGSGLGRMQKIFYFGQPYSFTHVAALRRFGENKEYISKPTIYETINSVMNYTPSLAVVPIENTFGGPIRDIVDLLTDKKYLNGSLIIKEELEMAIKLLLLSKIPIDLLDVKQIYSHKYALRSSQDWIEKNLPFAKLNVVGSTSEAAQIAKKERYSCAIASAEAAEHYHLNKLADIIFKGKHNLTKFFVMKKVVYSRKN